MGEREGGEVTEVEAEGGDAGRPFSAGGGSLAMALLPPLIAPALPLPKPLLLPLLPLLLLALFLLVRSPFSRR